MSVCIIGTGPAGMFAAQRILKKRPNIIINFLESSSKTFGLIRYGVAPDHPEVKVLR